MNNCHCNSSAGCDCSCTAQPKPCSVVQFPLCGDSAVLARINAANQIVATLSCLCTSGKHAHYRLNNLGQVIFIDEMGMPLNMGGCDVPCQTDCSPKNQTQIGSPSVVLVRMLANWIKTGVPRPPFCTPLWGIGKPSCTGCLTDMDVAQTFTEKSIELGFMYV